MGQLRRSAAVVMAAAVVVVAAAVVAAAVGSVGRRGWLDFVVFFGADAVALEVLWDPQAAVVSSLYPCFSTSAQSLSRSCGIVGCHG